MKKTLLALLLLSLTLTGCFYEPGRGYGYRGGGDREHRDYRSDHESRGYWGR